MAPTPELVNVNDAVSESAVAELNGTSAYSPPPDPAVMYTQASEIGVRTSPAPSVIGFVASQTDCLFGSVPFEHAEASASSPNAKRTNAPRLRGASMDYSWSWGLTLDDSGVRLVNGRISNVTAPLSPLSHP
jgi:hypothetical protein